MWLVLLVPPLHHQLNSNASQISFVSFCILMLSRANEDCNLDIIFDKDTDDFIVDIFSIFLVTTLKQLHLHTDDMLAVEPRKHCPKFPFFRFIFNLLERQIEPSKKVANMKLDLLADESLKQPLAVTSEKRLQILTDAVLENLKSNLDVSFLA